MPHRKSALPNGIRLVTETMPHVRSVAVGIWVETGSRVEPEALGGISHLIEHLVFKGTASRSAEEIARAIDSVGDVLTEGDIVAVKVIEIDGNGKMRLSRKTALRDQPALAEQEKLKIAPAPAGGSA